MGWLIGGLAQFIPFNFVIVASIIINRDVLSTLEMPTAIWTWIGIAPAVIAGYVGERVARLGMGLDVLWFLPACMGTAFYFEAENILSAYHNVALVYQRVTWGLFLSPAAAIFLSTILASVSLPILLLMLSAIFFDPAGLLYRRRYFWSTVVVE